MVLQDKSGEQKGSCAPETGLATQQQYRIGRISFEMYVPARATCMRTYEDLYR